MKYAAQRCSEEQGKWLRNACFQFAGVNWARHRLRGQDITLLTLLTEIFLTKLHPASPTKGEEDSQRAGEWNKEEAWSLPFLKQQFSMRTSSIYKENVYPRRKDLLWEHVFPCETLPCVCAWGWCTHTHTAWSTSCSYLHSSSLQERNTFCGKGLKMRVKGFLS